MHQDSKTHNREANKRICLWGIPVKKIAGEATALAVIKGLQARIPNAEITIFTAEPDRMATVMTHYGLSVDAVKPRNLIKAGCLLANCDLFVIAAGHFQEYLPLTLGNLLLVTFAKIFRRPIFGYGLSLFYFRSWWGRLIYRRIFNLLDAMTGREVVVQQILQDLGVKREIPIFADERFALDPAPSFVVDNIFRQEGIDLHKPLIALTPRLPFGDLSGSGGGVVKEKDFQVQEMFTAIAEVTAYLANHGQLLFIPMHRTKEEDTLVVNILKKPLKDASQIKVLRRDYDVPEVLGIIKRCDLLLTSRLGSVVMAAITGTPMISIAYEPRVIDFMNRMDLGEYALDWRDLTTDSLLGLANRCWETRQTLKIHGQVRCEESKKSAWQHAERAASLLQYKQTDASKVG